LKSEVGVGKDDQPIETWKIDSAQLNKAFEALVDNRGSARKIVIPITLNADKAATVELPADSLTSARSGSPDAVILILAEGAFYSLPVSALDLNEVALKLGVDLKDNVTMKQVTGSVADAIAISANDAGLNPVGTAIEFSVTVSGNGKSQNITDYGQTYVSRTIVLNQSVNELTDWLSTIQLLVNCPSYPQRSQW
jgi:hypothetical protein